MNREQWSQREHLIRLDAEARQENEYRVSEERDDYGRKLQVFVGVRVELRSKQDFQKALGVGRGATYDLAFAAAVEDVHQSGGESRRLAALEASTANLLARVRGMVGGAT